MDRPGLTLRLAALLAVVAVITPAAAFADDQLAPVTTDGPTATVEGRVASVDSAIRFRTSFGLRTDRAFVTAAAADVAAFDDSTWGVPLDKSELVELDRRLTVQKSLTPAIEELSTRPDYGGMYLDQQRGALPVFLFTSSTTARAADVSRQLPKGVDFEVAQVDHTLASLVADKDSVSAVHDKLVEAGIDLVSVSVHVRDNRVEVGVRGLTPKVEAEIKAIAPQAIVSEASRPVSDACEIDACGPGMKGGLKIQHSAGICTSGYNAMRTDVSPDYLVLVTAGHCVNGSGTSWSHNGTTIGTANANNGWANGSLGDVGIIKLNAASTPSTKNQALYNPDTNKVVSITGFGISNAQNEGYAVCRIGWGSWNRSHNSSDSLHAYYKGLDCGTIVLFDSDSDGTTNANSQSCVGTTCHWIHYMKVVDFDSTGGDSGGTIFEPTSGSSTNLWGTHVHSVTDSATANRGWYSIYTWGRNELSDLGITIVVCRNAACT